MSQKYLIPIFGIFYKWDNSCDFFLYPTAIGSENPAVGIMEY